MANKKEPAWDKFMRETLQFVIRGKNIPPPVSDLKSVVDLGCGFGTFSIPASQMTNGKIHAFDIDPEMIGQLQIKINQQAIKNIDLHLTDFIAEGSGFEDNSIDYVMLFNILHHYNPHQIFHEVYRILKPNAKVGIIHWRSDIPTPRGPQLDIRPKPEQCKQWAAETGFAVLSEILIEPYHFGILIAKS